MECPFDKWGLDVMVVGSQKALMLPPGLAFVAASDRAWKHMESIQRQGFYFDLVSYRKKLREGPDTPYTPAHTLIAALAENLKQIRAEGIENIWRRAATLSEATRAGIDAIGLETFAARPAAGLTAVRMPSDVDGAALLKKLESRFGIKLAGGQGRLKGKIFRIAHMGIVDELDILATLSALELVLDELGRNVQFGSGVAAASRILAHAVASPVGG
jgi:aspartate aminotransferase-like enzyme